MDRYLKPERFEVEHTSSQSTSKWVHWKKIFETFITSIKAEDGEKLNLLYNHISHSIFEQISECTSYKDAISLLDTLYIKPKNEIFARHKLMTRHQQSNESVDQFLQALRVLSANCEFKDVKSNVYRDEYIRDAFIMGLSSSNIRQRLLENFQLSLDEAFSKARALESAREFSELYTSTQLASISSQNNSDQCISSPKEYPSNTNAAVNQQKCYFCGYSRHPRSSCPARESLCKQCNKKGHFARVCQSKSKTSASTQNQNDTPDESNWGTSATIRPNPLPSEISAASPPSLAKSIIPLKINGVSADGLIDTGSTESFISDAFVSKHNINLFPTTSAVSMASSSLSVPIKFYCSVNLQALNNSYSNVNLKVLKGCCADVILGHDILRQHSSLSVSFGGSRPALSVTSLACSKVGPAALFEHLTPNCRPISIKSRRHSEDDEMFIQSHINELLKDGVIEESNSPWRAQVLVVNGTHRKRMVVDYSLTINKYTLLDAYPIPSIEKIATNIASYNVHSTIDLKSAYYQIPIRKEDRPYTAFEAAGKLWQYKRIPMGVTNGVAAFQRKMDEIKTKEGLEGVNIYLDDITVSGKNQSEHDRNLHKFLEACKKYNLTINKQKSQFNLKSIKILGYLIENNTLRPDPDRLKPLVEFPLPKNKASLQRALGMFSYYSKWIPQFSDKVHRLVNCKKFPLDTQLIKDFNDIRSSILKSFVFNVEENVPFCVETDASDVAIAATLTQNQRPVAFFSRTLSKSERHHSAVEKEAYAIIESLRKWRYYLIGRKFKLITDQKSISYMFDTKHPGKIKNEKFTRWRLELAAYNYDIIYRPGKENVVADALSRFCSSSHSINQLEALHVSLCHPGVTRMNHYIKIQNLPYTVEEVRKVTSSCKTCAAIKPRFCKRQSALIKSTAPFERLSIDFKGPLPSNTRFKYLLTVIDEYSRFPFAIPCEDLSAKTVIGALGQIFSIFGYPAYIHSDRGTSFVSKELEQYLHSKGIATSRTTPYNPCGNGQVERYNGIIWKTVNLALHSKGLPVSQWGKVLPEALQSIRSLLCTATNTTPHERMFYHKRKCASGVALPSWLNTPGKVLLRNFVRQSKYDPLVQEVDLLEANPYYALVRLPGGKETTVNLRHIAPIGEETDPHILDEKLDLNKAQVPTEPVTLAPPLNTQPQVPNRSDLINEGPYNNHSDNQHDQESDVTITHRTQQHLDFNSPQRQFKHPTYTRSNRNQDYQLQDCETRHDPNHVGVRRSSRITRLPTYLSDYVSK